VREIVPKTMGGAKKNEMERERNPVVFIIEYHNNIRATTTTVQIRPYNIDLLYYSRERERVLLPGN
jgi:hypothetical protein